MGWNLPPRRRTPNNSPEALICFVHGLGEHSGRYVNWAENFNQENIAFCSFDLRGHGKSSGKRGDVSKYDDLMDDVAVFLENGKARFPDCPQFLYGHSLGGNLAANYVLRFRPDLAGVIVTGPAFRLAFNPPVWKKNWVK